MHAEKCYYFYHALYKHLFSMNSKYCVLRCKWLFLSAPLAEIRFTLGRILHTFTQALKSFETSFITTLWCFGKLSRWSSALLCLILGAPQTQVLITTVNLCALTNEGVFGWMWSTFISQHAFINRFCYPWKCSTAGL